MTEPCDCGALRRVHTYRVDCERCAARAFARGPRDIVDPHLANGRYSDAFRAMVDEERRRDQADGVAA